MAIFTPDLDTIHHRASDAEWQFVERIQAFNDDYEVFYQPPTEFAHVDFAILKRGAGLFLVEVSGSTFENIEVKEDQGHEYYMSPGIEGKLLSPLDAVLTYKDQFYNLLSEELFRLNIDQNIDGTYGLIQTGVFLPNVTLERLKTLYNNNPRLNQRLYGRDAESRFTWIFVQTTEDWMRARIAAKLNNKPLFSDELYQSLKDILSGHWQQNIVRKENLEIKKYQYAAERKLRAKGSMRDRIRGVAGSGKTLYAVQRALIRHENTNAPVLVLCYNITLVNYLEDMIINLSPNLSDYDRLFNIQVSDYDSFMPQMMKINGFDPLYYSGIQDRDEEDDRQYDRERDAQRWKKLHEEQIKVFDSNEDAMTYKKYQTIIIDEYQDFDPEWLRAIEHHFSTKGGELIVLADEKQKIYDNAQIVNKELITPGITNEWLRLSEPHRMTNELIEAAVAFQKKYPDKDSDVDEVVIEQDFIHEKSILKYCNASPLTSEEMFETIKAFVKETGTAYENVSILSGSADILRDLEAYISEYENDIAMAATFESSELKRLIEQNYGVNTEATMKKRKNAARMRKFHFHVGSKALKLSTIHSFKGLETEAVVYILHKGEKNNQRVYTAITRAKKHLLVINMDNQIYDEFFKDPLNGFSIIKPSLNLPF